MITLLQNELKHHLINRPDIDDRICKNRIIKGDMVFNKINLALEKDLQNYLKEKLKYRIDKYQFLEAIKFTNSITIHNYFFIHSITEIVLKEYIAVASRNINDKNLIDLLIVYTEVILPIPYKQKVEELSTCVVLFGKELCKFVSKEPGSNNYDLREVLKLEKAV